MPSGHEPKHVPPADDTADAARLLLEFFDRLAADPAALATLPEGGFPAGSAAARLVEGVRGLAVRVHDLTNRYDLLMRGADDGLWDWDLRTDTVHFSPRWKQILGYEDHEIANHPDEWRSRIHPDDAERAAVAVRDYLAGRTATYELEHRLRHRDGGYRWIRAHGVALRDAAGTAYRFAGAHWDITERKRAEEELREREQQYHAIFEATSDGLVIYDLERAAIVEANPAFCRMHGYRYDEIVGLHPTALVHPDYRARFPAFLETVRNQGHFFARVVGLRKDGSTFHVEVRGGMFTFKGRPHALGVARDVTEQVEAQRLLEQRVEERTRELSALLDVSHNVTSTLELRPLLGVILDQLKSVADYTGAAISILDGDTLRQIERRAPFQDEVEARHLTVSLQRARLLWEMLSARRPLIIADVRDDSDLARAYRATLGFPLEDSPIRYVRSWMGVPLALKDRVIGMITLAQDRPAFFTARHAALATAIANHAAVAIENARLYEQARALAALSQIAASLTYDQPIAETLDRLAKGVVDATSAVACSMILIDQASGQMRAAGGYGLPDGYLAAMETVWQAGGGLARLDSFRLRQPTTLTGVRALMRATPAYAPVHPYVPLIQWDIMVSHPLIFRDRAVGALNAYFLPQSPPSSDEMSVLATIADQAAVAVENARLYAETGRHVRELDALYRADEQLHRSLHIEPVLQALVDVAVDILRYDASTLIAWDAATHSGSLRVARNLSPAAIAQVAAALDSYRGQPPQSESEPVTIEDTLTDPRVPPELTDVDGIRAVLQVPIVIGDELFGEFIAGYRHTHHFDDDEVRLMVALAQRAAIAIENARLYEQAHKLAALEERQRLARELHDSVSQVLFSISLGARTARVLLDRDPSRAVQTVEHILTLADMGMAEMRALIFELRPESLQTEGLVAALTKQTAALRARHGIAMDVTLGEEPDVPLEVKEAVYRIAQEAMHNTVKHAHATTVRLHLSHGPNGVTLAVSDDGAGFDPTGDFPGHLGLRSMRERVARFGGTLSIDSAPGRGTTVRATIPPG